MGPFLPLVEEASWVHSHCPSLTRDSSFGLLWNGICHQGMRVSARPRLTSCVPRGSRSQGPADTALTGTAGQAAQSPQAVPVQRLQRKLKEAAREIACLRREKEQLLELGNRLRAELGRPAGEPARGPAGRCALGRARRQGGRSGLGGRRRRS